MHIINVTIPIKASAITGRRITKTHFTKNKISHMNTITVKTYKSEFTQFNAIQKQSLYTKYISNSIGNY